jgi:hypothetical protein
VNRQQKRALARSTKKAIAGPTVYLVGGPMDGWHVTPDAPALQEGWEVPDSWDGLPGRYVATTPDGTQQRAKWVAEMESA